MQFITINLMNEDLRFKIAETVYNFGEGHIASAFSIIDIIDNLYGNFLKYNPLNPKWEDRDYFVLSKGHGSMALYVTLDKYGFFGNNGLEKKILGGHPDCNKVPGAEASTGSLGHGICTAAGIALGLKIKQKKNKVISLIGDGESNEGTVWETALVSSNLNLGNLCVIVDNNKSAEQVLSVPYMDRKWDSFGWETYKVNGHSKEILDVLDNVSFDYNLKPKMIIADTIKGKGVSFIEGHGPWHHKVPDKIELNMIREELLGEYGRS